MVHGLGILPTQVLGRGTLSHAIRKICYYLVRVHKEEHRTEPPIPYGGPQAVDIVRRELHLHMYIAGACPARLGVVAPEGNCSLDTDAPQWVKASGCISVGLY